MHARLPHNCNGHYILRGPANCPGGSPLKQHFARVMLGAAAMVLVHLLSAPAPAQEAAGINDHPKAPSGPAPRLADGKPDFTGVWSSDMHFIYDISDALKKGETLPIQPWALEVAKNRMSKDDPEAQCLPTGVPRVAPYP